MVKEQRAEKIMNKEKEFPNVEDVQINELVKITSPKLNKEAKVEEQVKKIDLLLPLVCLQSRTTFKFWNLYPCRSNAFVVD